MNEREKLTLKHWLEDKLEGVDLILEDSQQTLSTSKDDDEPPLVATNITTIKQAELEAIKLEKALSWLESPKGGLCFLCRSELTLERLKKDYNVRLCERCSNTVQGKDHEQ